MRLLFCVFVFSFFSTASFAAECQTDLGRNDDYRTLSRVLKCLQDRIRVLENRPASTGSVEKKVVVPIENAFRKSVEHDGFEWGFPKCKREGRDIACKVLIRNKSGRTINRYRVHLDSSKTTAFTDQFTQHRLYAGYFANWTKRFDKDFSVNFPDGIVLPLSWKIKDVSQSIKGFQSISLYIDGISWTTYKFNGVSIQN